MAPRKISKLLLALLSLILASSIVSLADVTKGNNPAKGLFKHPAMVIVSGETPEQAQEAARLIKKNGGRIALKFPPHILIGNIPPNTEKKISGQAGIVQVVREYLEPSAVEQYGESAKSAVEVWNDLWGGEGEKKGMFPDPNQKPGMMPPNDVILPPIEPTPGPSGGITSKSLTSAVPPCGADLYDSSMYLIGETVVNVIFLESNGAIDPSTEDWTAGEITYALSDITLGLTMLGSLDPTGGATFTVNSIGLAPTGYEPIIHASTTYTSWIHEAMSALGIPTTNYLREVAVFNDAKRKAFCTDWVYTIFMVRDQTIPAHTFTDGRCAFARLGGPFVVLTYNNDGWGPGNLFRVAAHESGHIFWALDEYLSAGTGCSASSGYLNVVNGNDETCPAAYPNSLMLDNTLFTDPYTEGQFGWRDSDSDGIYNPADTVPRSTLTSPVVHLHNECGTVTVNGTARDMPLTNINPYTSHSISINKVTQVEYRLNGAGAWAPVSTLVVPSKCEAGPCDQPFTISLPLCFPTAVVVEVRATNIVGNVEGAPYQQIVITEAPTPMPTPLAAGTSYIYPSPAKGGKAHFVYTMKGTGSVFIFIYNDSGQLFAKIEEVKPAGNQESELDLSSLAQGVCYYIVAIRYDSGVEEKYKPQKFVVMR